MGGVFFGDEENGGATESSEATRDRQASGTMATAELRELAARLIRIASDIDDNGSGSSNSSDDQAEFLTLREMEREEPFLADLAERIYDGRRRRIRFLDDDLFGEPAWDMLLDLFINHARKQRVPTTSLCIASQAPTTTALRWISILEQRGLVRRFSSERDQRVHYVELEEKGYRAVSGFLRSVVRK